MSNTPKFFVKPVSKSQFVLSQQCTKAFYLYRNKKELASYSAGTETSFKIGNEFGEIMKGRFPKGVDIAKEYESFPDRIKKTNEFIEEGEKTLFEATLSAKIEALPLLCMVDILTPFKDSWDIIEVKSSTAVKEVYLHDAAFQLVVAEHLGLKIHKVYILHVNNQYTKNGPIDLKVMGKKVDITKDAIKLVPFIKQQILVLKEESKRRTEPRVEIGTQCNTPYPCAFKDYCWKDIPKNSVFDFLPAKKAWTLYEEGIVEYKDVELDNPELNDTTRLKLEYFKKDELYVDKERITKFIRDLKYPIHHLDFETINPAVPIFDQSRPYQQIPFQYSLHLEEKEGDVQHFEYLADPNGDDPRLKFIKSLLSHMGKTGTILVYNQAFEKSKIQNLANDFPKHKKALEALIPRIMDLMIPFRSVLVYHPKMQNSYSIKTVLPVLVPELNYESLNIGDGATAMQVYEAMYRGLIPKKEQAKHKADLLEYCKLDTYAMVRLLAVLKKLV